jgi:hypothetical protein
MELFRQGIDDADRIHISVYHNDFESVLYHLAALELLDIIIEDHNRKVLWRTTDIGRKYLLRARAFKRI